MQYIVYAADSGIYNIVFRVFAQDPTRIADVERKVDDVRARHPRFGVYKGSYGSK